MRRRLAYDDTLYRRPKFARSASNYACAFVMMCDLAFYDPHAGADTVDAFLEVGRRAFGG